MRTVHHNPKKSSTQSTMSLVQTATTTHLAREQATRPIAGAIFQVAWAGVVPRRNQQLRWHDDTD